MIPAVHASWWANPSHAFRSVLFLAAIGHLISALQLIANRDLMRDDALLAWRCVRPRYRAMAWGVVAEPANRLFSYHGTLALMGARVCAAAAAGMAALSGGDPLPWLLLLVATTIALTLRVPFGRTAADHMAMVVSIALAIGRIGGTASMVAALWFIAAQAVLAYATAGGLKIWHRGWYDGTVICNILATEAWGHAGIWRLLRRRRPLASVAGSVVALGESAFPLVLALPPGGAMVGLACGFVFHAAVAAVMGLNLFVWAFGSTYPAILYCSLALHGTAP